MNCETADGCRPHQAAGTAREGIPEGEKIFALVNAGFMPRDEAKSHFPCEPVGVPYSDGGQIMMNFGGSAARSLRFRFALSRAPSPSSANPTWPLSKNPLNQSLFLALMPGTPPGIFLHLSFNVSQDHIGAVPYPIKN